MPEMQAYLYLETITFNSDLRARIFIS